VSIPAHDRREQRRVSRREREQKILIDQEKLIIFVDLSVM
jgi:hypothetical protein